MAPKTQSAYNLSLKVTEKGGISIYGLQRFPVTLYADQLTAILDKSEAIRKFIAAHKSELKGKAEKTGGPSGSTAI